jgi:hypothetical protein
VLIDDLSKRTYSSDSRSNSIEAVMKKIPIIGAVIAAILAFKVFKGKKTEEPDTSPGEGHPSA